MTSGDRPIHAAHPRGGGVPARRDRGELSIDSSVREAVLTAAARLLEQQSFNDLTVAQILTEAAVSRGSFYFYFADKHDVLAELVRRAVGQGHEAAQPWLEDPSDPVDALRRGITAGATLWRTNAPVLRAIVENWRNDPALTTLWLEQMNTFTTATATRLRRDPRIAAQFADGDLDALAASLTWLGERLYYLAAIDAPPFNDQETLVRTLLRLWTSALYGSPEAPRQS